MMTTTLNVNAIYIIIDQQASGGVWCQRQVMMQHPFGFDTLQQPRDDQASKIFQSKSLFKKQFGFNFILYICAELCRPTDF
jgi:hypothetical protein